MQSSIETICNLCCWIITSRLYMQCVLVVKKPKKEGNHWPTVMFCLYKAVNWSFIGWQRLLLLWWCQQKILNGETKSRKKKGGRGKNWKINRFGEKGRKQDTEKEKGGTTLFVVVSALCRSWMPGWSADVWYNYLTWRLTLHRKSMPFGGRFFIHKRPYCSIHF